MPFQVLVIWITIFRMFYLRSISNRVTHTLLGVPKCTQSPPFTAKLGMVPHIRQQCTGWITGPRLRPHTGTHRWNLLEQRCAGHPSSRRNTSSELHLQMVSQNNEFSTMCYWCFLYIIIFVWARPWIWLTVVGKRGTKFSYCGFPCDEVGW